MNNYFITGTSRGIGKALAELLLTDKDNFVYGMSRDQTISHANYRHCTLDMSDLSAVMNFTFPGLEDTDSITLINNSAVLGEITHAGKQNSDDIIQTYNIDLISPAILINNFLKEYQSFECRRIIMNISSGAAKKPLESWSSYCASKSGLAMLSEVVDLEQKLNHPSDPVYIFSVAPGIVDTSAQEFIRSTDPKNFGNVSKFIEFKNTDQLADPNDVAKKLLLILDSPGDFKDVLLDVRDFK
ncbi:MAG: SDR family NAD(P)-dependent oxidoreductase [Ignavibacteria bacterium]